MSLYLSAAKYNLRYNMLPQIAAAVGLWMLTPVIFGITALDSKAAAVPLELLLPFIGVILLTPLYSPEQDSSILDTIRARKTSHLFICGIRIFMAMILIVTLIFGFVLLMYTLECEVSLAHGLASCANAIFLGGLGILVASAGGNVVLGYIAPILYYVMDLLGGLKFFTIFSMMRWGTMDGKLAIFSVGACAIAASLWFKELRMGR